tara:strand:+ start:761 stop:943 length:183 start_codon:yes stop_codon:yes gene_type:complete
MDLDVKSMAAYSPKATNMYTLESVSHWSVKDIGEIVSTRCVMDTVCIGQLELGDTMMHPL